MIIKIGKTEYYITSISAYDPFIYCGYVHAWEYPSEWGETCGNIINKVIQKINIRNAFRDFTDSFISVETYSECASISHSYYFDVENQKVYLHLNQDEGIETLYNYEYVFGVCSQKLGVLYIDDFEYLPVVKDSFDLEQQADAVGSSKPSGMTGSITLDNHAMHDYDTNTKKGTFDFMLDGSIFGNDIDLYDNDYNMVGSFVIDDYDISETETTINIQDKRYG